ncbi:SnoaL-like polyketide cyclase [Colletotrichum lupini]|uniref:SnoaL-like polyketide cyclase n=1 Tax=Colletotrichum lupini TaxID=145971 RepID=A0A9Q8WKW6_9PEZI|nr:SnoaL-like polyketide cyclase [Colletotrichum lupini]UQC86405.1 SnoaL-like polyketide cyclase [Colletotrichum lupini]
MEYHEPWLTEKQTREKTFRDVIAICNDGKDLTGLGWLIDTTGMPSGSRGGDWKANFVRRLNEPLGPNSTNVVKIDMLLLSNDNDFFARLINRTTLKDSNEVFEFQELVLASFIRDDGVKGWRSLRDVDAMSNRHNSTVPASLPPPKASVVAPMTAGKLKDFYKRYIDCINEKTMERDFDQFCQPELLHNGRKLSISEYIPLISESQDAIEGLEFCAYPIIAVEETQQIAARIEFTGTPVKEWGGAKPNGEGVFFEEFVIYQLEDGKISSVWSVVDLEAYRKCMGPVLPYDEHLREPRERISEVDIDKVWGT